MKRDDNRKPMGGAISLADLSTALNLNVDPVTNRLLIDITLSSSSGSILPTEVGHDQNRQTTGYGVADNANINTPSELLMPLMIDSTNGYLFVDIIVG